MVTTARFNLKVGILRSFFRVGVPKNFCMLLTSCGDGFDINLLHNTFAAVAGSSLDSSANELSENVNVDCQSAWHHSTISFHPRSIPFHPIQRIDFQPFGGVLV